MKLMVAGQDRSADLGAEIVETARRLAESGSPDFCPPELSALALRQAGNESEYLDRFIRLAKRRFGVDLERFRFSKSPGFRGICSAGVRKFLWVLLRHQHEYVLTRQNLVNEMLIHALARQAARHRQEIDELKKSLEELRAGTGSP